MAAADKLAVRKQGFDQRECGSVLRAATAKLLVQESRVRAGRYAGLGFAVFADLGPTKKIGEGSIELLRQLGEERIKADGRIRNAGMSLELSPSFFQVLVGPHIVRTKHPACSNNRGNTTVVSGSGRKCRMKLRLLYTGGLRSCWQKSICLMQKPT
jgi:hypothetical protein